MWAALDWMVRKKKKVNPFLTPWLIHTKSFDPFHSGCSFSVPIHCLRGRVGLCKFVLAVLFAKIRIWCDLQLCTSASTGTTALPIELSFGFA